MKAFLHQNLEVNS